MGVDPTGGVPASDWPAAAHYRDEGSLHGEGPSVTIFDLSLVANDVLENVTALLGRILFDFAVRSQPRAAHPLLLVLEEAHRFIPSRQDPTAGLDGQPRSSSVLRKRAASSDSRSSPRAKVRASSARRSSLSGAQ
jgi:hypothetical protein